MEETVEETFSFSLMNSACPQADVRVTSDTLRVCMHVRMYVRMYTYGNGFTTGALRRGGIQAMPAGQEILDVGSSGVHDAKAGDVDGAVLDHLALPSVVHYLITVKHTGLIRVGDVRVGGRRPRYSRARSSLRHIERAIFYFRLLSEDGLKNPSKSLQLCEKLSRWVARQRAGAP